MATKFDVFWQLLNEKMDFTGEGEETTKAFMREALEKAGLTGNVQPVVQVVQHAAGAKRVSGWNLYMKDRMAALKEQIKSGSERLKTIGGEWKAMTKEQQEIWNAKAKADAPVEAGNVAAAAAPAAKKQGHVSGWNLYMKDRMAALKEQIKSGSERLKTIGAEWKAMTKEQQAEWNAKAK